MLPFITAILIFASMAYPATPARIVSTTPSATEILYALGLGDRVVGVTTYCHHPPEAQSKPKIGSYIQPDLERIASLRPDLVIIQRNPVQLDRRLAALNLKTLEISHDRVEDIYHSIEQIGAAAGAESPAKALNGRIRADLDRIRARASALPRRRTMFIIGRTPGMLQALVSLSRTSYLHQVLEIAGGQNIFADAAAPYPKISLEEVIARRREVIIDMGEMANTVGVTDAEKRAVQALWNRMQMLPAVSQRRVYAVASDIFVVPGPRVVDAAREFARMIHPEAGF
jgi:iron complex transport system substrate-binding protein